MDKKFYVTTAIDYTNDVIHIGHAYQKILADTLARYHRTLGEKVFFLTGTDEYGETSALAAAKSGQEPRAYVDEISGADKKQLDALNISYDRFIRTTDPDHAKVVENLWRRANDARATYFGEYKGLYCVGCESYKTVRELKDGKCLLHPTRELETIIEKNYFFRWSHYAAFLKGHILAHSEFIQPAARRAEMLSFIESGLEDIPVSRANLKWGLPVPDDPSQVIYVWFDALINYVTGAPAGFWPADLHLVGKDNVRWHALLWPSMLKAAGYELPKTVYGHGFLSLDGEKISKSRGNVIRPTELTEKYGVDVIRYYLLRYGPLTDDTDLALSKLEEIYNSELVNGLGNHVARVLGLAEKYTGGKVPIIAKDPDQHPLRIGPASFTWKAAWKERNEALDRFNTGQALEAIWKYIRAADNYIGDNKPWQMVKEGKKEEVDYLIFGLLDGIHQLAWQIYPFMPETARRIAAALKLEALLVDQPLDKDSWTNVKPGTVLDTSLKLFPRRTGTK